jgi:small conductance mechanosensitive channel
VIWYVRNGEVLRLGNKSQGWSPIALDVQIADDADLYRAADLVNGVASALALDEQFKGVVIEVPTVVAIEPVMKPVDSERDGDGRQAAGDALTLRVRGTCATNRQYGIQRELRRRIQDALDAGGIQMPASERLSAQPDGGRLPPPD